MRAPTRLLRCGVAVAVVLAGTRGAPAAEHGAPARTAERLATDDFQIRADAGAGGGVMGARKLTLVFPADGEELAVKWKPAPHHRADGWNNSPRKELAAYAVQRLFLDPEDDVVPTTVARCMPLATLRSFEPRARPTIEGTRCVLGLLAVWLDGVVAPARLYDAERFRRDPAYARHLGDLNLLTYLIKHQDGRRGNFLLSTDAANPRAFAVDNGIAFGTWLPNFLVANWDTFRVPALRKESVDRLRGVAVEDLVRLGVLAELRVDRDGILRPAALGPNREPGSGARVTAGTVQLGLTGAEIDALAARIRALLADVDRGAVRVE